MAKIIVFEHINFDGRALIFNAADTDLVNNSNWNDRISSVIVVDGLWELYQHNNFGGADWLVSPDGGPTGDGLYPNWSGWAGTNDSISSLKPV